MKRKKTIEVSDNVCDIESCGKYSGDSCEFCDIDLCQKHIDTKAIRLPGSVRWVRNELLICDKCNVRLQGGGEDTSVDERILFRAHDDLLGLKRDLERFSTDFEKRREYIEARIERLHDERKNDAT